MQTGNPHRLTVKQHVFPSASIKRYATTEGTVQVYSKRLGKVLSIYPKNSFFCVNRVWDQKSENGIGKSIEDAFQALADRVVDGSVKRIGIFEKIVVEEYLSLWRSRHDLRHSGLPDYMVNGVSGDSLTLDQQEILEKNHTMFISEDGKFLGRFMAGPKILIQMDYFREQVKNVQWGIARARSGEFLVPDCFGPMMIVPISPNIALIADLDSQSLTADEVALVNRNAVLHCTDYYFSRALSCCPIVSFSNPWLKGASLPFKP